MQFDYRGDDPTRIWLVIERGETSVCTDPPGFDIDLVVTTEPVALMRVFSGITTYARRAGERRPSSWPDRRGSRARCRTGSPGAPSPLQFVSAPWHNPDRCSGCGRGSVQQLPRCAGALRAAMVMLMITVESLTKKYGAFTAVDDISFTASSGRVTGFLGPNGAGKSTTMRMMVGLTPASHGTASIAGHYRDSEPGDGGRGPPGRVRAAPGTNRARSSPWRNERWACRSSRVSEMLELVSLTDDEADSRVGNYSLGMRQRLGIATALLGSPRPCILDEPANGLDPAGIRWMRDLLRGFADQGGTVLLSSHLLHEIEVIADDLVVIGNGRIVAAGPRRSSWQRQARLPVPRTKLRSSPALARAGQVVSSVATAQFVPRRPPPRRPDRLRRRGSSSPSFAPPRAPAWRRCSSS